MANNKLMVLWLYAAIIGMLCGGCNTTNPAGKALVSVAITVDGAMKGWATWVHNGLATPEQEAKVAQAYAKYQVSFKLAQQTYAAADKLKDQTIMDQVMGVLTSDEQAILNLIAEFQKKGTK